MKFLVFGSLNIDLVYQQHHIVAPGETIVASNRTVHAGGKGANQAAALARSGAETFMAGNIGPDGQFLLDELKRCGADINLVKVHPDGVTGHAVIQLSEDGENAICVYSGTNHQITPEQITEVLSHFNSGDVLLIQNEVNNLAALITAAAEKGLKVAFNPAPFTPEVMSLPLDKVSLLIVNQVEAGQLTGADEHDTDALLAALSAKFPNTEVVLTLGSKGAAYLKNSKAVFAAAGKVKVVDTTGAGDTFIGFFLSQWSNGATPEAALAFGNRAAGIAVTRLGAMTSIPAVAELN